MLWFQCTYCTPCILYLKIVLNEQAIHGDTGGSIKFENNPITGNQEDDNPKTENLEEFLKIQKKAKQADPALLEADGIIVSEGQKIVIKDESLKNLQPHLPTTDKDCPSDSNILAPPEMPRKSAIHNKNPRTSKTSKRDSKIRASMTISRASSISDNFSDLQIIYDDDISFDPNASMSNSKITEQSESEDISNISSSVENDNNKVAENLELTNM